ncbi:unnamed protein product [Didymodactylos carnosus]|uniref:Eukaryotic translation initiation factor 2 subunit 2 n=1 Tax=Didymodactylos carnosus TaxID=1234261 RepID=A0A8S2XB34_9BILA|nr:unnamed protein product [Didymodactylos carnosus]CAF3635615.1 unnamed protein product [Didymodactylos carnosus]CAF4488927.1 unnamed protein product [Didymodactylos carnosus]
MADNKIDNQTTIIEGDTVLFPRTKKKHRRRGNENGENETTGGVDNATTIVTDIDSAGDYTYEELLTRLYSRIPSQITKPSKITMRPPQIARVGTKRTSFSNFGNTCKALRREEKHLQQYLLTEFGSSGSIDSNHALIIRGRFQPTQFEFVLRSYIREYVICKTCGSPETLLQKEERLPLLLCTKCCSRYFVSVIKTGFQAQVGRRAATRVQTT